MELLLVDSKNVKREQQIFFSFRQLKVRGAAAQPPKPPTAHISLTSCTLLSLTLELDLAIGQCCMIIFIIYGILFLGNERTAISCLKKSEMPSRKVCLL